MNLLIMANKDHIDCLIKHLARIDVNLPVEALHADPEDRSESGVVDVTLTKSGELTWRSPSRLLRKERPLRLTAPQLPPTNCRPKWNSHFLGHCLTYDEDSHQFSHIIKRFLMHIFTTEAMATPVSSVQSLLRTKSFHLQEGASSFATKPGDGFAFEEADNTSNTPWDPPQEYAGYDIASLQPGPKCVKFTGRVANLHDQATSGKRPRAATGCLKLVIKDDSGAIMVRLWYGNVNYNLRLGDLVSVWTTHVSNSDMGSLAPSNALLFSSVFPERDRGCHIIIHTPDKNNMLCQIPLDYQLDQPIPGLMMMGNFFNGGHEVPDGKLLHGQELAHVVFPNLLAGTSKAGFVSEFIHLSVFDSTADAMFTLWGAALNSASTWVPSNTILLITNPGWCSNRPGAIYLKAVTYVDVDPAIPDAQWLRSYAQKLTRKCRMNPPFPEQIFNPETIASPSVKILYNLADLDALVRANLDQTIVGYLSVVLMEVNIGTLHRRGRLMCSECCGVQLYANTWKATCKQCNQSINLLLNPRILGQFVDETGALHGSKLIFSTTAWVELLGSTPRELCEYSAEALSELESRFVYSKLTLCFGREAYSSTEYARTSSQEGQPGKKREIGRLSGNEKESGNETETKKRGHDFDAEERLCIWGVRM